MTTEQNIQPKVSWGNLEQPETLRQFIFSNLLMRVTLSYNGENLSDEEPSEREV